MPYTPCLSSVRKPSSNWAISLAATAPLQGSERSFLSSIFLTFSPHMSYTGVERNLFLYVFVLPQYCHYLQTDTGLGLLFVIDCVAESTPPASRQQYSVVIWSYINHNNLVSFMTWHESANPLIGPWTASDKFGFIGLPNIIGSSMSLFNQLHDLQNVLSSLLDQLINRNNKSWLLSSVSTL